MVIVIGTSMSRGEEEAGSIPWAHETEKNILQGRYVEDAFWEAFSLMLTFDAVQYNCNIILPDMFFRVPLERML